MKSIIKQILLLVLFFGSNQLPAKNPVVDGYRGIWYTLNQFSEFGDKYSGGLGTYTSNHLPVAIYSPEANKTFFVYGGTPEVDEKQLMVMISYYDHKTRKVPRPVVVYSRKGVDDPHDNGTLSIDGEGYIWVFASGRNVTRPGVIFKSTRPYSIDSFEKVHETIMTYPQPWWFKDKGFIYLFTKYTAPGTRGRELYWSTSIDGKKWSEDQKLAGISGHYQLSAVHKEKLVTVFNYHPQGSADTRTNLYLAQTSDMGKSWQTVNDQELTLPLQDPKCAALVYDYQSEGKLVYLNDLTFDSNGNPVVLAVVSRHYQPGTRGGAREWITFHWKDQQWIRNKVCESTHNYDMGSLYIHNNEWIVIGPTDAGPQYWGTGGEMVLWKSTNEGNSWKKVRTLTANSERNHSYARRPLNAHKDFYTFWADGNADSFSKSALYFANKKGNKVWQLPYNMNSDFARPIRFKAPKSDKADYQPFGVNLASAEFNEANLPGEYDKHYTYPTTKQLDYFKSKGLMLIRLPFKWERIQPDLNGALDQLELIRMKTFIEEAKKRKMKIIPDLHNYGRRVVKGKKTIIGTNGLTVGHFADLWQKLAVELKGYTNIYGYGLMNEPHDLSPSVSWFEMAQAAITSIRSVDEKTLIIVGGDDWSSAERWIIKSDTLKYLNDPSRNLMFEAHVYFDADASGSYKNSFDEEGCSPTKGIERVYPFVKWLKVNGFRGIVGEYGVPDTDERWLETMDNFLSYLQREGVLATYWAAGPWWGKYKLSLEPRDSKDRPQMKIVEKYLNTK